MQHENEEESDGEDVISIQSNARNHGQLDDNFGNIRVNIPPFQGKSDPEAYLDWESKVENFFECHNYSEQKKVRMAALEFVEYALV